MRSGDLYLVCSDGLVGMVDDTGISRLLERHVPSDSDTQALEAAARALVEAANEGGVGGTFRILKNVMGLWILQASAAHGPTPAKRLRGRR